MTCLYVDGAKLALARDGTGTPVILLHSSLSSAAQWRDLTASLADRFHIFRPDHYGCGRSDPWPGLEPFSLAAEAAAVARTLRAAGEPVHLVGHSYGGALAFHIASRHRHAVKSLTLIEPSAFHLLRTPGDASLFAEISAVATAVDRALLRGDCHGAAARFVDYWNGAGAFGRLIGQIAKIPLEFRAIFQETTPFDAAARLEAPALLVHGDRSPAPSLRLVELFAGTLPHCRTMTVPGAGHMAPITHAGTVSRIVGQHLESVESAPRRAA